MFSFFRSSKKTSPAESPDHNSDSSLSANIGDDYVLIEQRGRSQPDPFSVAGGGVYPSLGPAGGSGVDLSNPSGNRNGGMHRQQSDVFSYLEGVPFKLSPLIRATGAADPMEVWGFEVDQILANMTRAVDLCSDSN